MKKTTLLTLALTAAVAVAAAHAGQDLARYGDDGLRAELADIADADIAVLVPMRDGVGLSTNIWRPKGATGPLPTILWKTPYNEHVPRGSTARFAVEAVRNGYAFIVQNERGRYFSFRASTRSSATRRPTATTCSAGLPGNPGRTARSARWAARRRPNGSWRWRR
nr:CocE/NonD family hydrolase [Thermomonas sp. S9]